eukprot:7499138-Pyramimonas_sp.AAC.1
MRRSGSDANPCGKLLFATWRRILAREGPRRGGLRGVFNVQCSMSNTQAADGECRKFGGSALFFVGFRGQLDISSSFSS